LAGAQAVCHSILDDVQRFASSEPIKDDITALALVRSAAS
jgi:serine phosphatase RsbU (regulator of sigma subunit)